MSSGELSCSIRSYHLAEACIFESVESVSEQMVCQSSHCGVVRCKQGGKYEFGGWLGGWVDTLFVERDLTWVG